MNLNENNSDLPVGTGSPAGAGGETTTSQSPVVRTMPAGQSTLTPNSSPLGSGELAGAAPGEGTGSPDTAAPVLLKCSVCGAEREDRFISVHQDCKNNPLGKLYCNDNPACIALVKIGNREVYFIEIDQVCDCQILFLPVTDFVSLHGYSTQRIVNSLKAEAMWKKFLENVLPNLGPDTRLRLVKFTRGEVIHERIIPSSAQTLTA